MMVFEFAFAALRFYIGILLAAHGSQKVFGWFGGPGIEGWRGALKGMNLRPAGLWAWLSAGVELIGGLLFAFGVLTPVVAAAISLNMLMAIILVHWENGFFARDNGFEFPLTLLMGALTIGLTGSSSLALGPQTLDGQAPITLFAGAFLIGSLVLMSGLAIRQWTPDYQSLSGD